MFRIAIVRPVGDWVENRWDDWPESGVIIQVGSPMMRDAAVGHAFSRNSMLRMNGTKTCAVLIRAAQDARVGDIAKMPVPVYDVA